MVPWSRGMIPRLQRGDHEFESRRNHSIKFLIHFKNLFFLFKHFFIICMVPWSRGMIPRLQRGDHEFESRRNHLFLLFNFILAIF